MMTRVFFALAFILSAVIGCVSPVVADPRTWSERGYHCGARALLRRGKC